MKGVIKKGVITDVREHRSKWQIVLSRKGKKAIIKGDLSGMLIGGIKKAFGSPKNAIGQEIEYAYTGIRYGTVWRPTGVKKLKRVV